MVELAGSHCLSEVVTVASPTMGQRDVTCLPLMTQCEGHLPGTFHLSLLMPLDPTSSL